MTTHSRKQLYVTSFRKTVRFFIASPVIVLVILSAIAVPLAAFEAHVINVIAIIEQPPLCDALSVGYWANHDGCSGGTGSSIWVDEVHELSSNVFSGAFGGISAEEICVALRMPLCPSGSTVEARRCRAKSHTLADELNIITDRLQLNALIALADDGDSAFDTLGLSPTSTVEEALIAVENVILDMDATRSDLRDAAHVAQRIYAFYEDENPNAPMCIYDPEDIPEKPPRCLKRGHGDHAYRSGFHEPDILDGNSQENDWGFGDVIVENINNAFVENEIEVTTSTSNGDGNLESKIQELGEILGEVFGEVLGDTSEDEAIVPEESEMTEETSESSSEEESTEDAQAEEIPEEPAPEEPPSPEDGPLPPDPVEDSGGE